VKHASTGVVVATVFDWHRAILDPLVCRFREWRDVDYVSTDDILTGWRPARDPQLVVVCDAGAVRWLREIFSSALFMHVGHGLISKNQTSYHYREPDFVCVASQSMVHRLTDLRHTPRQRFFATGLIQTDPLFRVSKIPRSTIRRDGRMSVVYAPTWNDSLTSAEMFGDTLVQKIRGDNKKIKIVIKPHPHIAVARPEWIAMWTDIARENTNVYLCDADSDLIPALLQADLMVSDASSAVFHFLALNRPIVLVNNPQRFNDADAYDPDGIEWTWRDIAVEIDHVDDVKDAVKIEVNAPQNRETQRLSRRRQLFGGLTDGRSCERVHSAAVHVLERFT
jgi:hypothetical protein